MPTKKKRFMLAFSEQDINVLNFIAKELNTKQYSKVIRYLINVYFYVNNDKEEGK